MKRCAPPPSYTESFGDDVDNNNNNDGDDCGPMAKKIGVEVDGGPMPAEPPQEQEEEEEEEERPVCELGCLSHTCVSWDGQPFMEAFKSGNAADMRKCMTIKRWYADEDRLFDHGKFALVPTKIVFEPRNGGNHRTDLFSVAIRDANMRAVEFWAETYCKDVFWKKALKQAIEDYEHEYCCNMADSVIELAVLSLMDRATTTSQTFRSYVRIFNALSLCGAMDVGRFTVPLKDSLKAITRLYKSGRWDNEYDAGHVTAGNLVCAFMRLFMQQCYVGVSGVMKWFLQNPEDFDGDVLSTIYGDDSTYEFNELPDQCKFVLCPSWFKVITDGDDEDSDEDDEDRYEDEADDDFSEDRIGIIAGPKNKRIFGPISSTEHLLTRFHPDGGDVDPNPEFFSMW